MDQETETDQKIAASFACEDSDAPSMVAYRRLVDELMRLPEHPDRTFVLRFMHSARNATRRLVDLQRVQREERRILQRHILIAGAPPVLGTLADAAAEVRLLDRLTTEQMREEWDRLSSSVVSNWLSVLVARARAAGDMLEQPESFRQVFARLPAYTKTRPTGWINGLQVRHTPTHASWREDALVAWTWVSSFMEGG